MKPHLSSVRDWPYWVRKARYNCDALAGLFGKSLRTLQRFFKREFRVRLKRFVHALRMEDARDALLAGHYARVVAGDVGYKQQCTFTVAYAEHFGYPPRETIVRYRLVAAVAKTKVCREIQT
jgi:transcriptional regulator GlxA family with amidase domain